MNKSRAAEKNLGDYLSKLIYATIADISSEWDRPSLYSPHLYQSYENLCLKKEERADGVKGIFSMGEQIRQHLATIFNKVVEELQNVQLVPTDTQDIIFGKLADENAECYSSELVRLATHYGAFFGPILKAASDESSWINGRICGAVTNGATVQVPVAIISSTIDSALKALAWLIGNLIWYKPIALSGDLFLGILAQNGFPLSFREEMFATLRVKPPAKRKDATPPPATTTAAEPAPAETEPAPVETEDLLVAIDSL